MFEQDKLQEVITAKQEIVKGSLTIWNARLEAFMRAGDFGGFLSQMIRAVEGDINVGCNVGCNSCGGTGGSGCW